MVGVDEDEVDWDWSVVEAMIVEGKQGDNSRRI